MSAREKHPRVTSQKVRRGRRVQTVKRDCDTGEFVPTETRANRCGAPRAPALDPFTPRPGERFDADCYPTKGQAIRAFVDRNRLALDAGGGLDQPATGGEYDPINEKLDRRGARRITTMREALRAGAEKCLSAWDLELLNQLPGCAGACELPDVAYVPLAEEEARYYAERLDDEGAPF